MALVLRLLLLPLPPSLSDDILRYVWDGKLVSAGFNPYLHAPEDPVLTDLRDPLWERMPHKDVPTVYPPLALTFFAASSIFPSPLVGVKVLLTAAELLACWLIVRLALALGLPAGRAAWYAWNPLASLEVAGMGHVDGLLAATVLGVALFLVVPWPRPAAAGAAAAAGVLAKLVPLVALPFWARQAGGGRVTSRRAGLFLLSAGLILAAVMVPVVVALGGPPPGLVKYGVSWEFNGPLYEPLWRICDRIDLDSTVKSALDQLKTLTGRHEFWNRFYPFVYPQLMAKVFLLGLFGFWLLRAWWLDEPAASTITTSGRVFGAVALCSATFYPWYLLWVLPWAALARQRAWLVLSATLPLSYLPQLLGWPLFPWIWLLVWGPFFAFLAADSSWSID